jgi:hypothetical protein
MNMLKYRELSAVLWIVAAHLRLAIANWKSARRHRQAVHHRRFQPTTTTTTVVDNGTFKTRTEAETGMKTMKVCTENWT